MEVFVLTEECQAVSADRLESFLVSTRHQPMLTVDADGRIVSCTPGFEAVTGYPAESVLHTPSQSSSLAHIVQGEDGFADEYPLNQTLADGSPRRGGVFIRHREGFWKFITYRTVPVLDAGGAAAGAVEIFSEPDKRAQASGLGDQLKDTATGLFNRKYLLYRLQTRYAEMQRYDWNFAVILVRVAVRPPAGADAAWADRVAVAAGKTLAGTLRTYDVVGRWGADEFLAIVPVKQPADLDFITRRLRHLLEQTLVAGDASAAMPPVMISAAVAEKSHSPEQMVEDLRSQAAN